VVLPPLASDDDERYSMAEMPSDHRSKSLGSGGGWTAMVMKMMILDNYDGVLSRYVLWNELHEK
jgi:hypothetical protein